MAFAVSNIAKTDIFLIKKQPFKTRLRFFILRIICNQKS